MKCRRCTDPDYCACHDFFTSFRAFWRGDYDHLMTPEQVRRRKEWSDGR